EQRIGKLGVTVPAEESSLSESNYCHRVRINGSVVVEVLAKFLLGDDVVTVLVFRLCEDAVAIEVELTTDDDGFITVGCAGLAFGGTLTDVEVKGAGIHRRRLWWGQRRAGDGEVEEGDLDNREADVNDRDIGETERDHDFEIGTEE